jgi:DnaB helicase-like protein
MPTTTVPPHSLDAERSVLGALLVLGDELLEPIAAEDQLRPEHFYRDQHALVFAAMLALHQRHEPIDTLTVCNQLTQLRGGLNHPVAHGRDPEPAQPPPDLGISRSRTANGTKRPARRSARTSARNCSSPRTLVMYRAVWPSTPAVRAPRFLRTRSHATTRKLGSVTRPNRSSNRRSPSSTAQRCSLVWIPSTLGHASRALGHGAPIFTGDLLAFQSCHCEPAAALRHVPGFPRLGLIRRLRPAPTLPADDVPAHPTTRRDASDRFPRSPQNRLTGSVPSFAPAAIHEYAADLPHSHPGWDNRSRRPDSRPIGRQVMPLPSPDPPGFELVDALRSFRTLVPHVHLSVSLAGPRPSGSADQSRRCQGRFPPFPASPRSGCPQLLPGRCDDQTMMVFHLHSIQ